ncbi:MAG: hypothetical protein WB558_08455 [Terriglobales bacterium]
MTPTNFWLLRVNKARSLLGTRMRGARVLFRDFCNFCRISSSITTRASHVNVTKVSVADETVMTTAVRRCRDNVTMAVLATATTPLRRLEVSI